MSGFQSPGFQMPYAPVPIPSQEPGSGGLQLPPGYFPGERLPAAPQLPGFLQHMPQHIGWFGPHGGGIFRGTNPGIQPGNPRNPAEGIHHGMVDPAAVLHHVYQNMLQQQQVQNLQNAVPGGGNLSPIDIQAQAAKLAQVIAQARGNPGPRLRPIRTAPEPTQLFHNPTPPRQVGPPPMNPGMGSY